MEYTIELLLSIALIAIGIGFIASLFGIGGGFLLLPSMIMLVGMETHLAVGTVAFVIPFMALSSTAAYTKQKRIDFRTTAIILLSSIVGSILGAGATSLVTGKTILILFGVVEIILAAILGTKKTEANKKNSVNIYPQGNLDQNKNQSETTQTMDSSINAKNDRNEHIYTMNHEIEPSSPREKKWYIIDRRLVDSDGIVHEYHGNLVYALPLSFLAGFLSSLLGIGGGTLYIQIFVFLCGMPIHIAIASSMFTILVTTFSGAITFSLMNQVEYTIGLAYAIGMIIGAQFGAAVNKKIKSQYLKPMAAIMIMIIAVRMIIFAVQTPG